eukprot:492588-Pelagomonas_calceolata.AAC.2
MERGCINYADGPLEFTPHETAEYQSHLQHVEGVTVMDTGEAFKGGQVWRSVLDLSLSLLALLAHLMMDWLCSHTFWEADSSITENEEP